jgi:hypothetical protein
VSHRDWLIFSIEFAMGYALQAEVERVVIAEIAER